MAAAGREAGRQGGCPSLDCGGREQLFDGTVEEEEEERKGF